MAYLMPKSPGDAGESLARELFDWCGGRLASFRVPAWFLFVDNLPTTSSQKGQTISRFPPCTRAQSDVIDLRPLQRKAAAP